MNNTKTIYNVGKVGGDYFRLMFVRTSKYYLKDYLSQFNINDYWILKSTRNFKLVSVEEMKEFKYATYVFFKKDLYSKKFFEDWLKLMIKNKITIPYLIKPLPPEYIKKLIKVIDEI